MTTAYAISHDEAQELETRVNYRQGSFRGLVQVTDESGTHWSFGELGQVANLKYNNPLKGGSGVSDRAFSARDGKTYSMKLGRNDRVMDPATVLEPLLDGGWEVSDHRAIRGGIWFVTTLTHPANELEDFITWDLDRFPAETRNSLLRPSIQIMADLQRSSVFQVTAGFFRLICTNGLVAKLLGMGQMSFNARTFNYRDLVQLADNTGRAGFDRKMYKTYPTEAVSRVAGLLGDLNSGAQVMTSLPRLVQGPANRLYGELSSGAQQTLVDQVQRMEQMGGDGITHLDILNGITNSSKNIRVLGNLDNMGEAFTDLLELMSWQR